MGHDLRTIQALQRKHEGLERDFDLTALGDKINLLDEKASQHTHVHKDSAETNTLHQFLRDIANGESWIKEKKLLVTSDDCGRDLTRVQNLHKRIESEEDQVKYFSFSSGNFLHRNVFHKIFSIQVLEAGAHLIASSTLGGAETEQRLQQLTAVWQELKGMELEESIIYQ